MPLYQSELDSILKGIKTDNKAVASAPSDLTPVSQLQSQSQQNKPSTGGWLSDIGHIIATPVNLAVKATKAVANPAIDLATGQGGAAVNAGAHLASDLTGGVANQVANKAANQLDYLTGPTATPEERQAIMDNQTKAQQAVKSGKVSQQTQDLINKGGMSPEGTVQVQKQIAQGAPDKQVQQTIQADQKAVDNNNKQAVGAGLTAASFIFGGGEAKGAVQAGSNLVDAATQAAKVGVAGAVGNAGQTLNQDPNANAAQLGTSAATGFAGGVGLGVLGSAGGALLGKFFNRGAQPALDELNNLKENPPAPEQKLLPAGQIRNDSTSTVVDQPATPGTPAVPGTVQTPKTIPVTDKEYAQRFNALSKSFDQETKAAQNLPPLAQKIALDDVHDRHVAAVNQLHDEYLHGKPNPDYQPAQSGTPAIPGTPATTKEVPSGFVIQTPADQAHIQIEKGQSAQLNQRIGQINSIIKDAQQNGSSRNADELRSLMRERQQAQDVLDGKANYNDVYGNRAQPGPVNQGMPFDNAPKQPTNSPVTTNSTTTGNPILDAVHKTGYAFMDRLPKVAKGDTKQSILNRNYVVGKYQDLIKPVQDLVAGKGVGGKQMDAHDIALIDKIEGNHTDPTAADAHLQSVVAQAHNPKQFLAVVDAMREGYNTRLANDASLGREVGIRNNYLQHFFDTKDEATQTKLNDLQQKTQIANNGKPGYMHTRTVENYAKANELGLKRLNANALEDYAHAMTQAGGEHGAVALRQGLEEAHPGQVQVGKVGRGTDGQQYDQLKISGGQALSMPKALAAKYNARAPYEYKDSVAGKGLKAYDALNAGVKYAKLGGGLFHSFTTAGTVAGHQLSSLNLFKHPVDNLKVIAGTVSSKAHEANFDKFRQEGSLDFARQVGTTLGPKEILADADVNTLDKATNVALKPIKALHDMVFQRQIPEAKMLILRQSMKQRFPDMDFNHPTPEQINYGRETASAVNNMGGINRAVSGMSYGTAKQVGRAVLAADFTEGKFRVLYAALAKGGVEGKIARRMVVGKSLLFALPGMVAGVANGTINPNDPKSVAAGLEKQFLSPSIPLGTMSAPNETNPGGTPQVAELPKTFISELGSIIAPALDKMSTDKLSGLKNYASARVAALPGVATQLAGNKDFYGNHLWGTDKNGNKISGGQAATNIAGEFTPIPINQGTKAATHQQTAETTALNTVGFRVANDTSSPQGVHSKAVSDFYNTTKMLGVRQALVRKQVQDLVTKGQVNQAQRVIQQWNASLDAQTRPFRTKYAAHYNPAWDDAKQGFMSYALKNSDASIKTRQNNAAETAKILSTNY
jgi:hypothetical protein